MASRKPIELQNRPALLTQGIEWGRKPAVVKYTVDGDTFGALVDWGGAKYVFETVRFFEASAPEPHEPGGMEAKHALAWELPEGTHVLLHMKGYDKNDRIVCLVTAVGDDGYAYSIVEALIEDGHLRRDPQ